MVVTPYPFLPVQSGSHWSATWLPGRHAWLGVLAVTALIFVVSGPVALVVPVLAGLAGLAWRPWRQRADQAGRTALEPLPLLALAAMVASGVLSAASPSGQGLLGPFGWPAQACALVALAAALVPAATLPPWPRPAGRETRPPHPAAGQAPRPRPLDKPRPPPTAKPRRPGRPDERRALRRDRAGPAGRDRIQRGADPGEAGPGADARPRHAPGPAPGRWLAGRPGLAGRIRADARRPGLPDRRAVVRAGQCRAAGARFRRGPGAGVVPAGPARAPRRRGVVVRRRTGRLRDPPGRLGGRHGRRGRAPRQPGLDGGDRDPVGRHRPGGRGEPAARPPRSARRYPAGRQPARRPPHPGGGLLRRGHRAAVRRRGAGHQGAVGDPGRPRQRRPRQRRGRRGPPGRLALPVRAGGLLGRGHAAVPGRAAVLPGLHPRPRLHRHRQRLFPDHRDLAVPRAAARRPGQARPAPGRHRRGRGRAHHLVPAGPRPGQGRRRARPGHGPRLSRRPGAAVMALEDALLDILVCPIDKRGLLYFAARGGAVQPAAAPVCTGSRTASR